MSTLRAISITLIAVLSACSKPSAASVEPTPLTEQQIVDRIYIISNMPDSVRNAEWLSFIAQEPEQPNRTAVEYLGTPDSPLYAPLMLDEYLEVLIANATDVGVSSRAEYLLENYRKNRVGEPIADLDVVVDGRHTTLHRLIKGESLVVIYDPDCTSCAALFDDLRASQMPGVQIITVSITEQTKPGEANWIMAATADEDQLEDKFYLPTLPMVYTVSGDGIIK